MYILHCDPPDEQHAGATRRAHAVLGGPASRSDDGPASGLLSSDGPASGRLSADGPALGHDEAPRRAPRSPRDPPHEVRIYFTECVDYTVLESQLPHKIVNTLFIITY